MYVYVCMYVCMYVCYACKTMITIYSEENLGSHKQEILMPCLQLDTDNAITFCCDLSSVSGDPVLELYGNQRINKTHVNMHTNVFTCV